MSSDSNTTNLQSHGDSTMSTSRLHHFDLAAGRAVTDAVHERFRNIIVYCESCKQKFIGNGVSITKHFDKAHIAHDFCIYCQGKVFHYYKVKIDNNKAEKFYFHKCEEWKTK